MFLNQGKKCIFRPIDKEEREMFQEVTSRLDGEGYDPLAVKLWPINGGDNSVMYIFLCAVYHPYPTSGGSEINLALVYIAELTAGHHEFKFEKIEKIASVPVADNAESADDSFIVGGWNVIGDVCPKGMLPENLATGFPEAFQGFVGPKYEVMVYCATQLVQGANHMLICGGIDVAPEAKEKVVKVILHETLPEEGKSLGHFTLSTIEPITNDIGAGAWVMHPSRWADGALPKPLAAGYQEAMKGFVGSHIEPLIFCGTQNVHGTNYMIICKCTPISLGAKSHIIKLVLHETPPEAGRTPGYFSILYMEQIV